MGLAERELKDQKESKPRGNVTLSTAPLAVLRLLVAIIVTLHVLSLMAVLTKYFSDGKYVWLTQYVDVGIENNIPTIYSAVQLIFTGLLCLVVSRVCRRLSGSDCAYWLVLGFVMIFLGFDEGATIHEMVGSRMEAYFERGGYLYWLWVVPYGVLTAWFAAAYFPFLMRLPKKTRIGLIVSGAIFVCGAIGVEMISAAEYEVAKEAGVRSLRYYLMYSFEEFLEMLGIALFVYFVLDYLALLTPSIEVKLRSEG